MKKAEIIKELAACATLHGLLYEADEMQLEVEVVLDNQYQYFAIILRVSADIVILETEYAIITVPLSAISSVTISKTKMREV